MGITITIDQVTKLAPDDKSVKAGIKLAIQKYWSNLGQGTEAIWGECQGSALYRVSVAWNTFATQCSCPSSKKPCKHALGLLFLLANMPAIIPEQQEDPAWVRSWLDATAAKQQQKEARAAKKASTPPPAKQAKTIAKREAKIQQGIDQLNLWLNDLVRNGLGNLNTQPETFWQQRAALLVDAQAPGLATRVRGLASVRLSQADWPEKLLGQLGKIALLTEAYTHLERLDQGQQDDIRQMIGWTYQEAEILHAGRRVQDEWLILGQITETNDNAYSRRTWLRGSQSGHSALIFQFAVNRPIFNETFPLGTRLQAELAFWPGSLLQRGMIVDRQNIQSLTAPLPGVATCEQFLTEVAQQRAKNPWQDRFLCVINQCHFHYDALRKEWLIQDQEGAILPLQANDNNWRFLALSGGNPIDFAGEWNGETLNPLGIMSEHSYHM